jgi:hypothetical protein
MSAATELAFVRTGVRALLPDVSMEDHGTYVDLLFEQCRVSIEIRPPYCDRGRFIVKVDQTDPRVLTVDFADGSRATTSVRRRAGWRLPRGSRRAS